MNVRILLFLMLLCSSVLNAQDTIRTLIITEARIDRTDQAYIEITNVGDKPIPLKDFKFGRISAWDDPWIPASNSYIWLPDEVLDPGESYVIATVHDLHEKMYPENPRDYRERINKKEIWDLADLKIHRPEPNSNENDSVTPNYQVMEVWNGFDCWYLEQHLSENDSVITDQVGGVFDSDQGRNKETPYDVAGVTGATFNSVLIRKSQVSRGNINFNDARGVGQEDSEWIPVPLPYLNNYDPFRAVFWTLGNHGNFKLQNSLISDVLEIDFENKTITAPWGVRNNDDFMLHFEKMPGIAWHYHLSESREDSAFMSARTGDKITIYACGDELEMETFDIIIKEPSPESNIVIPKFPTLPDGFFSTTINSGNYGYIQVTENNSVMDTITNSLFGIPFALRTDTLLKYLEKAPNASWEFIWADGIPRPDLKNGDILKVTSENGKNKEYFIKMNEYLPSENAYLNSVTWPDLPVHQIPLLSIYGWKGDTIPNFAPTVFNYNVTIPDDFYDIPALIPGKQNLNSVVKVERATSLSGTLDQRTIRFNVTAEDGETENTYSIQLEKEKKPENIQSFSPPPFLSEVIFRAPYGHGYIEICNPGNQPLDLSDYLIIFDYAPDPAEAILWRSGPNDWNNRYHRYIPGYKWVDKENWAINPGTVELDLKVNSIVYPGDVFVMGHVGPTHLTGYPWFGSEQCDVIFNAPYNPWNEPTSGNLAFIWWGANFHMYKILNDSIKNGLKPVNDPNDFELVETFGMGDGSQWEIGGELVDQAINYIRKPEYWRGKTKYKESFGTNPENSEWTYTNRKYWQARNAGWPNELLFICLDLGKHFLHEITDYKSTVTSVVYKVSEGYSMEEEIRGMTTGTTVGTFMSNLNKAHENQTLTVKSGDTELGMDDLLSMDDILVVLSADSANTTQYILEVSEYGLSSDALLSSEIYEIEVTDDPIKSATDENAGSGYITGFEYGTQLRTVLNNVTVPRGASISIIDGDGAYVPLKMLNFDTAYVNVTVNPDTYFDVVAENGITRIVYQLQPRASENDAFILSDIYTVMQAQNLVNFVPRGTNVQTLLSNIVPSLGATVKVVDKMGLERTEGSIYEDDKVVVTSPNGLVTRVYHLSMLRTQYILETTYLAYVLSDVYQVDQVNYEITGPSGATLLTEFYARITPSMGATAVVVDANGNEKTSGDLDDGDMLKVTSADGKIVVMYELKLDLTSVELTGVSQIEIYPNPTNGRLNVSGLEQGNRIQVFNASGAMVCDTKVQSSLEVLSLDDQPAGMLLIVISNESKILGRYKAIKK